MSTITLFRALALLVAVTAAGCSGDRFGDLKFPGFGEDKDKDKAQTPPINMAGRWMLTSPNRGQCNMNFSGGVKVTEGAIAPEGGCPGRFFTSRRWTLEEGNVIIRDHNGEELAKLAPAGVSSISSGRWLEGQATNGERVMLARQ